MKSKSMNPGHCTGKFSRQKDKVNSTAQDKSKKHKTKAQDKVKKIEANFSKPFFCLKIKCF